MLYASIVYGIILALMLLACIAGWIRDSRR